MSKTINDITLEDLKPEDLALLAASHAMPSVTILLPTHPSGPDTRQGSIRLKNALDRVQKLLHEKDYVDTVSSRLMWVLNDGEFWQHQRQGLAIFATDVDVHFFRVRHEVPERVSVGEAFYLKPLLGRLSRSGTYFVLTLSWDEARLFRGNADTWQLVETDLLPAKFLDLVGERDPEESLQQFSFRSVGNSGNSGTTMFHGHGEGESKIEADRRLYLLRVADLVATEVYSKGLPLLLVATKEVAGHFSSLTDLQIDGKVLRSPAQGSQHELHALCHELASETLRLNLHEFTERFGGALAHGRASNDVGEVISAAMQGRVETLMVASDKEIWGDFDRQKQQAILSDANSGSLELLNHAVIETLRTGGDVYAEESNKVPGQSGLVAAVYRY